MDASAYLHACDSCRHVFTLLPPEQRETYDDTYFEDNHKRWFEHPDLRLFEQVEKTLLAKLGRRPASLLDVGCGQGDFLKWLRPRHPDWRLVGIDLVPNAHPGIEFIQGDVFQVDPKGPFDLITAFMVIEHLENNRSFFDRIRSLLAPNGILMANTFNNDSLIFRTARLFNSVGISSAYRRLYSRHHVQHYSTTSIRRLFELSGFEVLDHRRHGYPLAAVDVPRASLPVEWAYRAFVGLVFLVAEPLRMGIEHTIYGRRTPQ